MDFLFILAIFLLPFENLFFAPSAGWATITPIILFIYVLVNCKHLSNVIKSYGNILTYILIFLVPMSFINYLLIDRTVLSCVIDSLFSFFLGITNLFAFDIYINQKKNKVNKITKILLTTYYISLFIGLIQFIAVRFNIGFIKNIFSIISKRNYINMGRVQFTFTEPSYIGMHMFGILLPIYYITKEKKILKLICIYLIAGLLFSGSVKLILDILMVLFIIMVIKNITNIKIILLIFFSIPVLVFSISMLYSTNYRVKSIIDNGIYADGSLASRYFRINAAFHGYSKNYNHFIFGYGLGNSIIPMKDGYIDAYLEYKNSWTFEIDRIGLEDYYNDSESLCFYTKIISDFGILTLILFLSYIFKLRKNCDCKSLKNYIWIILYLYIQFESYAFYTFWLYIVFLKSYNQNKNMLVKK